MRYPIRASELVHRRLWVPPSPLHDPSAQELHDESSWGWETVRCVLDWGHQSGIVRPCSCPAGVKAGQGPKDAEHAMPLQIRSKLSVRTPRTDYSVAEVVRVAT